MISSELKVVGKEKIRWIDISIRGGTMRSVTWNDELRVGVSLFDDEHHEMIDLLNDMREQISSNASDVDITEAFKNFVECGVTHFAHEEELMEEWGYPEMNSHKKEHDELLEKVHAIYEQYEDGKKAYSLELVNFLADWMMLHLKSTDRKYVSFFESKGVH